MNIDWTKLTDIFRTCAYCGSFFSTEILCHECWNELPMREQGLVSVQLNIESSSIEVLSLLDWFPHQSPVSSSLIAGLKGGGVKSSFDSLAMEFVTRWLSRTKTRGAVLLVPAPTNPKRRGHGPDHALVWSLSLTDKLGAATNNCLRTSMIDSQKTKNREERTRVHMTCDAEDHEKIAQFKGEIVFVDDVVTTGSTAKAAYIALGRPPRFQVWSIAYRHLAAD